MNVTILSAFRNAAGPQIARYFEQMDGLQALLHQRGDKLKLLLGYGDSTDGTGEALFDECSNRFDAHLLDVSHGGKAYGSIEHPERFKQLATIGNKLLDCVDASADVLGVVESDLIWDAETMLRLIDHIQDYVAVAPMVMDLKPPDRFRDVYAFRRNGVRFTNHAPYHADLNGEMLQVDSAGSVLFMRGELARKVQLPDEDVIVGLCRQLYEHGGAVYVDPTLKVVHP